MIFPFNICAWNWPARGGRRTLQAPPFELGIEAEREHGPLAMNYFAANAPVKIVALHSSETR